MAGELFGAAVTSLDSGGLYFAVQNKTSWSFGADLGSGAFSDETESRFSYLSCTVCEAVMLCAIFVSPKVCEFLRSPSHGLGLEAQIVRININGGKLAFSPGLCAIRASSLCHAGSLYR